MRRKKDLMNLKDSYDYLSMKVLLFLILLIPFNVGSSTLGFPTYYINPYQIADFIKEQEGGLSDLVADNARKCTTEKYHTNKGITYTTFKAAGYKQYKLFLQMPDSVWDAIWIYNWHKSGASQMRNQNLANLLAWWTWGTGMYNTSKETQILLNKHYNCGLQEDGIMGKSTIDALNGIEPCGFIDTVITHRKNKLKNSKSIFLSGWLKGIERFGLIK